MDMRSVLFQLIASRGGGQGNPAVASFLASMQGGSGTATMPNAQDLLSQIQARGGATPEWVANLINGQRSSLVEPEHFTAKDSEPVEKSEPDGDVPPDSAAASTRPAPKVLTEIWAERCELKRRNDALAAALGACHECWGERPDCRLCGGEGKPGSTLPNSKLFSQWVLPAIRAVRNDRHESHGSPTNQGEAKGASEESNVKSPTLKGDAHEPV